MLSVPGTTNGNGELTRQVLRAELDAGLLRQTISFRDELDERFKPVNEHIKRVDEGILTQAQENSIMTVVIASREKRLMRMYPTLALLATAVSILSTSVYHFIT